MSPKFLNATALVALALAMLTQGQSARALDWTKVSGKDITLFYPAQMSWEMLLTQSEHGGAEKFRDGKNCRGCHEGEEQNSGNLIVGDKSVEATPIPGKPGSIKLNVKAAHDAERIYFQLAFAPGAQPDAGMDKEFSTKVAIMFDDGGVAEAGRAGCWAACHDNATRMPSAAGKETTKYLARSRVSVTRKGGEEIKPAAEIDAIRAAGGFLEYWQARLVASAPPKVVDGTVLEKRSEREAAAVTAEATESNGQWIVTFSRKLDAGAGYKAITAGKAYTVGFSVHAGHAAHRFHYVSLEKTLAIDAPTKASGTPDFVAAQF